MLAAETDIAVSYARAFTKSTLRRLSREDDRPSDPERAAVHDALYGLRDVKYAHTDKNSGRDAIQVMVGFDPATNRADSA